MLTLSLREIIDISEQFILEDEVTSFTPIETGNINGTFRLDCKNGGIYLLQNINTVVFQNTEVLMNNVDKVCAFLREKTASGATSLTTLFCYPCKNGKKYYTDAAGRVWRIYNYIRDSVCYNILSSPELFCKTGRAFGEFQKLLADFPIEELGETIPGFHDTAKRYATFLDSVEKDVCGRVKTCMPEVEFVKARAEDTHVLTDLLAAGKLPLRVTHNDTKLNNILFDAKTLEPKCVVDLDTVMPGLSLYDFGDAIRSGASTAEEDETDLSKVSMSMELYEAYTKGYLSAAGDSLTPLEIEYLPFSAKLLSLECGIRFLTDYLDGDVYFRTKPGWPEHNLVRCRTQFKLVADIESKLEEMAAFTKSVV